MVSFYDLIFSVFLKMFMLIVYFQMKGKPRIGEV